jgi:AraC-like DNA-binding protein
MDYRVRLAVAIIQRNMARSFDVSALASAVGVSASTLRTLFGKCLGVSPQKFVKGLRMEHARYLLCTQSLSVKEIMYVVGCTDESHFVRDFQRVYGLSPRRYRHEFFGRVPRTALTPANELLDPPMNIPCRRPL